MLAVFPITLREGLEAALIVGIVLSVLRRLDKSEHALSVWWDVFRSGGCRYRRWHPFTEDKESCISLTPMEAPVFTPLDKTLTPPLLYDPPIMKRLVPELRSLVWMFPADPEIISQVYVGQGPAQLPAQRLVFHWDQTGDFQANVNVMGRGTLGATLYNGEGNPVANTRQLYSQSPNISVAGLAAGWYAMDIEGETFPTYFEVSFGEPPNHIFLPVVLRNN